MYKVSVIIPVFNVERYLSECLDSVIGQTLTDLEILCVEDHSSDGSLEILKSYADKDKRITVIANTENRGPAYSRNRGLDFAGGEYIYFLDSDDKIIPAALQELYDRAREKLLDGILFEADLIFESQELKEKYANYNSDRRGCYDGVCTGRQLFAKMIPNRDWMCSVPRQFWKKSYLQSQNLRFPDGILHEDELFSFLAILQAGRLELIKNHYFQRRFRRNSIMTSKTGCENIRGLFISYYQMLNYWMAQQSSDMELNQAVDDHLFMTVARMRRLSNGLENMDSAVSEGWNPLMKHMFRVLADHHGALVCDRIEPDDLQLIKSFGNHVIIYGAGAVGRDVLQILDKEQIGILGFAVTEKKFNPEYIMGHPVREIEKFMAYSDNSIVLVAVTRKFQDSMLAHLRALSFKNILPVL